MRLHKQHWVVDDAWFCNLITVQEPLTSAEAVFPCFCWLQGEGVLSLPEGTGEQAASHPAEVGERGMLEVMCWGGGR